MKTSIIATVAILSIASCAVADPSTGHGTLIDDADPGWTWSEMVPYSDVSLAKGTGHAGGSGSYGVYTFSGTAVDVYVMRSPAVAIDGRMHKCGKLKVLIDGHLKVEASVASDDSEYNYDVYSVTGLPAKYHVLQVQPDAGWAVIDYIKVDSGDVPSTSNSADASAGADSPPADPGLLFGGKDTPLAGYNLVDARENVDGFNTNIGPELQPAILPDDWGLEYLCPWGQTAVRYSGSSTAVPSYCYMLAYRVSFPLASNTWMTYWILPQQDNGRYVGVDLHCTDGTVLSTTDAVDQNNVSVAPSAGHGGQIPLYGWTPIRCHVGEWLAGKTVDKIWIGYSRNQAAGQYRGYIDDLIVDNEKPLK